MAKEKPQPKSESVKLTPVQKAAADALANGERRVFPAGTTEEFGPYRTVIDPNADDHITPGG